MTGVQTCALPICFPVTIMCFTVNNYTDAERLHILDHVMWSYVVVGEEIGEEAVEGKREKKKQKKDNDVDDGGASLLRREVKGLEHLKKLAHATAVMDERSYKRALGVALRKGLEEQQKEVGVVLRVADCDPDYDRFYGISSTSRLGNPLYRPL